MNSDYKHTQVYYASSCNIGDITNTCIVSLVSVEVLRHRYVRH